MRRLLLDTSFLVAGERSRGSVAEVLADDDDVAIAAVTVAELLVGVRLTSGRRRDARQAYVEEVTSVLPVVAYDIVVAEHHAKLLAEVRRQGRPRGAHDLMIAASASATDRAVVTTDHRAFAALPNVDVVAV